MIKELSIYCAGSICFSKYAGVASLKDKRGISILNRFQKIFSKGCKPNKTWVDHGGEFLQLTF